MLGGASSQDKGRATGGGNLARGVIGVINAVASPIRAAARHRRGGQNAIAGEEFSLTHAFWR
jgi:hypothetical protein